MLPTLRPAFSAGDVDALAVSVACSVSVELQE